MNNRRKNILMKRSVAFSIRIIKLYKHLCEAKKEFVMSKQLLRSGTAIGVLISESEYAQSKPDFVSKLHIAIKEANESNYRLSLLSETGLLSKKSKQKTLACLKS